MKADQLLNQILPILHSVKDDEEKLQQILDFLLEEIYEEPDEEPEIPEKYRELVKNVAISIDCGVVCFINADTLEMEVVLATMINDPTEYRMLTGIDEDDLNLEHDNWDNCITVEPPESRESFRIMERFVNRIDDKKLQKLLVNALEKRRPFANFKNVIDDSEYREQWFAFKQRQLEEYVWQNIEFEILK
jgi:hypothetical protein